MTFSIAALDRDTCSLGVAVQSKFPGVSRLVAYGSAELAVIATQAFSNPDHGRKGLEFLRLGVDPDRTADLLLDKDPSAGQRQLAILCADGRQTYRVGDEVLGWDGHTTCAQSDNAMAQGNSLKNAHVTQAMVDRFEEGEGDFTERLIAALQAGEDAGGDLRGLQSAGVHVWRKGAGYEGSQDMLVDISIYDHHDPIGELARCYELHRLSYFPSDSKNLIEIDAEIDKELTTILARENYLRESYEGWDETKIAAMARFMGVENYDNRIRHDRLIDRQVLDDIRKRRA